VSAGVRIVDASGPRREIGRAHGEEMRDEIAEGIGRWQNRGDDYIDTFLAATHFVAAIDAFTPRLMEEVHGIAEGSRQRFNTVLAYQMMDEEWAFRVSAGRSTRASIEACSAFGVVREDGTAIVAQNMDLPSHYDGTQVVLRLQPDDTPGVMVLAPAGMLGTCGLNSDGVGVCVNALFQLRHDRTGLPVGFVLRGLLERRTAGDAARFVSTVPHATAQNYLIGDATHIADFEASPGKISEVPIEGGQVAHTNHVLVNDDFDRAVGDDPKSTTVARLDKLHSALRPLGATVSVDDVKRTLSDRSVPVCVPRGADWMTFGSVVMQLSATPAMHVAPGPPGETPYSELRFD
jgi:isopenicillin-N N-acyltransferase like protein